ncbi:hypothetical protein CDAR_611321 [Caerostris darwini]|uniref:Uncharacterized protein n=1 Tax=Caerostris darwini TaxID=1538125 RepID=A0AAV4UPT0_9ARAC|nr:hypothetical protein CDAR_611321 [Caerostris darwini]
MTVVQIERQADRKTSDIIPQCSTAPELLPKYCTSNPDANIAYTPLPHSFSPQTTVVQIEWHQFGKPVKSFLRVQQQGESSGCLEVILKETVHLRDFSESIFRPDISRISQQQDPCYQPISRYYIPFPHSELLPKYCTSNPDPNIAYTPLPLFPSPPKRLSSKSKDKPFEKPVTSFLSARQHQVNLPAAFTPRRSSSRDSPFKRFLRLDISPGYFHISRQRDPCSVNLAG